MGSYFMTRSRASMSSWGLSRFAFASIRFDLGRENDWNCAPGKLLVCVAYFPQQARREETGWPPPRSCPLLCSMTVRCDPASTRVTGIPQQRGFNLTLCRWVQRNHLGTYHNTRRASRLRLLLPACMSRFKYFSDENLKHLFSVDAWVVGARLAPCSHELLKVSKYI